MAGKYTKFTSNYIKRSKHQNISNGSIFERNWVTTGSKLNFGKDKTPYYNEGGFIFTTSNVPTFQKKLKIYGTTNVWKYEDVKDVSDDANKIVLQENSNDLRDFAYFGSCVTLVQTSIENIIKEFPASIFTTNIQLEIPSTDNTKGSIYLNEYILDNPFEIDLYHKDVALSDYDNSMRYMYCSNRKYTINGEEIVSYVIETDFDTDCPQYNQWNWKYEHNGGDGTIIKVTINGKYVLNGYKIEDDIVFTCKDIVTIRPIDDILVEYFNGLKGFERFLLNCNSKPLYSNYIITPIEGEYTWEYSQKRYTWPVKDDYCIDINSANYAEFINKLYDTAQKMDELWTDNVYRNMTHEAIKNFDWTYQREYIDGEEEDNVEGGEMMQNILRFCGRVFDDVKAYADGIALMNKVTYDSYSNKPNSQLKNELEVQGWEAYSIIPNIDGVNNYYVDETFLNNYVTKESGWITKSKKTYKWFPTANYEMKSVSNYDNDFMRRLIMSSAQIFRSKGTIESIRMVMGMFGFTDENDRDYSLKEDYYKVIVNENKGDAIAELNNERRYTENYDEDVPYWGLPVKDITFTSDNSTYALPFFDEDNNDKANFYYQSKGGWGRYHDDNIDLTNETTQSTSSIEYSETLSYLRMCSKVSDLLSIGQNNLKDGDIYYVYDLTDYLDAGGEEGVTPTHFFKVRDYLDTDYLAGWKMIDTTDGSDDAKKALYLESIITNMSGNNPHTGYGNYDCGKNYIDNMMKPFANIEESMLSDEQVNSIQFTSSQMTDNDKIKLLGKICKVNGKETIFSKNNVVNNDTKNNYYLNSKILFMKNNTSGDANGLFKTYFRNIILPYVMQVIPSTTILVLQNY